jgi:beta-glucosidase
MTFPRSVGQEPLYYNHYSTGRPGPIDLVFWSHYTDESYKPLYPFGYGLSYTKFDYSDFKIDNSNLAAITVSVMVKNTGKFAGEEVTQLYIHDKIASVVRPVKELKGFQKFRLNAGESKSITFTLTDKELGFYNNDGEYIVEPGEFEVMVGTNSQTGLSGTFIKK